MHDRLNKYIERRVDANDFASLIGISAEDIPSECHKLLGELNFCYKVLTGTERDNLLLESIKKIDSNKLSIAGGGKKSLWESGWSENLQDFIVNNYDLKKIIPHYYRPNQPVRIWQEYVKGDDPFFEYNFFRLLRAWIYVKHLKESEFVYEFGCGPGHNLVALAELYPKKQIFGYDWAKSSVDLVNKVAETHKLNISCSLFDMFSPDNTVRFKGKGAVVTMGALEQLGDNYRSFLDFLLEKKPEKCIHIEPLVELYDDNNLLDYLAIKHHKKRNLLGNYLEELKRLEAAQKLKIESVQRVYFGPLLIHGWSYIVWRRGA